MAEAISGTAGTGVWVGVAVLPGQISEIALGVNVARLVPRGVPPSEAISGPGIPKSVGNTRS